MKNLRFRVKVRAFGYEWKWEWGNPSATTIWFQVAVTVPIVGIGADFELFA